MMQVSNFFRLNYGQKLFLLAMLPLICAVTAISIIVTNQSKLLAEAEIKALEIKLIEAKKAELKNYVTLARNAFFSIYGRAAPDDQQAKLRVTQILAAMIYGDDGFYFVYDYDGNNIVSPRQTELINKNWAGQVDPNGVPITDELIRIARSGAGYHYYIWPKPSSGKPAEMVTYVTGMQSWRWALGTGVFIDDILRTVATTRADLEKRNSYIFVQIGLITFFALFLVFLSGFFITVRERRLANTKHKALIGRIVGTQEEERGRVARELHDSISQILVGVRYALDVTSRRILNGDEKAADTLNIGIDSLTGAIQEVRRISRDLRPSILDDLGLSPAIKTLVDEFSQRTGITTDFSSTVFRKLLDDDSKIALYRIAQEALTNIERHSSASHISVSLKGTRRGGIMEIEDNGQGFKKSRPGITAGLGLRNMEERIEQLGGQFKIKSNSNGTKISAQIPLTHILSLNPNLEASK